MGNFFGPLRGVIYDKGSTKTFPTPRGEFKVRIIKVEVKEQGRDGKEYSQIPEFKLMNDNCNVMDYGPYSVGAEVDLWFTLSGKKMEWKDKQTGEDRSAWKTEVVCTKIKAVKEETVQQPDMGFAAKDLGMPAENKAMMNAAVGKGSTPSNPLIDESSDFEDLPF